MVIQMMMIDVKINFKLRWLNVKLDILVKKFEDAQILVSYFKVIPQKKKLLNNFFILSLKVPYQCRFWKIKKTSHYVCLGDTVGQTCPIYACTGTNHTCLISSVHNKFCCSWKQRFWKQHWKKNWLVESLEHMEQFDIQFVGK